MSQIREAIAMGCDEGTLLLYPEPDSLDASSCATIFSEWLRNQQYDVLMSSCCTADSQAIQIGILTATMLKIPAASYVHEIRPIEQQNTLWIKQQFEDYSQNLKIVLPCLLSVLPKRNQTFYMSVDGIAKAYSVQIPVVSVDEMLNQKGIARARELVKIRRYDTLDKKSRKKGRVLTVPVDESIDAIMELLVENHVLRNCQQLI